jgi:hypothetical protein
VCPRKSNASWPWSRQPSSRLFFRTPQVEPAYGVGRAGFVEGDIGFQIKRCPRRDKLSALAALLGHQPTATDWKIRVAAIGSGSTDLRSWGSCRAGAGRRIWPSPHRRSPDGAGPPARSQPGALASEVLLRGERGGRLGGGGLAVAAVADAETSLPSPAGSGRRRRGRRLVLRGVHQPARSARHGAAPPRRPWPPAGRARPVRRAPAVSAPPDILRLVPPPLPLPKARRRRPLPVISIFPYIAFFSYSPAFQLFIPDSRLVIFVGFLPLRVKWREGRAPARWKKGSWEERRGLRIVLLTY